MDDTFDVDSKSEYSSNPVPVSYGDDNDLNLKSVIAISRAAQMLHRQAAKNFKVGGVTMSQFSVLETLYHKGGLRICEIIEKTLSTSGNMTVVIDNLVKLGYIEKCIDAQDRRAMKIHITEAGKAIVEMVFPDHVLSLKEIFDPLSVEEKNQLLALLKKLTKYETKSL